MTSHLSESKSHFHVKQALLYLTNTNQNKICITSFSVDPYDQV